MKGISAWYQTELNRSLRHEGNERYEDSFDPGMVGTNPGEPEKPTECKPEEPQSMFLVPEIESPTKPIKRSSETLSYVEDQAALDAMSLGDEIRLEFTRTGMRGSYLVRRVS